MKLKNKKTGEIVEPCEIYCDTQDKICIRRPGENFGAYIEYEYNSLSELNSEWEDTPEEPKGYYYVTTSGLIKYDDTPFCAIHKHRKEIGNYFETKEKAEKAVEKLKAWKRLKDGGFRFERWFRRWLVGGEYNDETRADLDLLFGGEE